MPPEQLAEAMKELGRRTEQAAEESKSLADALDQDLLDACEQGDLTDEQLEALAQALGDCKDFQRGVLGKLIKARLVDGAELGALDDACEGDDDGEELALLLAKCKDGKDLDAALAAGLPGKGGPGGGGPPAAMTWHDETSQENAKFKEKTLPPAAVASLKDSRKVGVSRADPTAAQPSGGSSGGALDSAQAGGGRADASHSARIREDRPPLLRSGEAVAR